MISERMKTLLRHSAAELRDGSAPLGHAFLVEHDVTLDEAYDLAEWLAAGADALLELDRTQPGRNMIALALGAAAAEQFDHSRAKHDARNAFAALPAHTPEVTR